jgi:hypothetical protein
MIISYFICTEKLNFEENEVYNGCLFKTIKYSELYKKIIEEKKYDRYDFNLDDFTSLYYRYAKTNDDYNLYNAPEFTKIEKVFRQKNAFLLKEMFYYATLEILQRETNSKFNELIPGSREIALKFYKQKEKNKFSLLSAKIQDEYKIPKKYKNIFVFCDRYCMILFYHACFFFLNFLYQYAYSGEAPGFFEWLAITPKEAYKIPEHNKKWLLGKLNS